MLLSVESSKQGLALINFDKKKMLTSSKYQEEMVRLHSIAKEKCFVTNQPCPQVLPKVAVEIQAKESPNSFCIRKYDACAQKCLTAFLATQNRQILKIFGNCFFRCISQAIYDDQRYHSSVRNELVALMRGNRHLLAALTDTPSNAGYEEHLNRMIQNSTWGTQAEIFAAATYLQHEIRILTRIEEAWIMVLVISNLVKITLKLTFSIQTIASIYWF